MTTDSRTDSTASSAHAVQRARLQYTLYKALSASGFAVPFVYVFMVDNGVTYTDLGLGATAMAVVMIAAEVPSGYLADRFGRRDSILIGQAFGAVGSTGYLFAQSTATVVATYCAFGLGAAVRSGTVTAWLYETLDEKGASDRYAEIASRFGRLAKVLAGTTMLVGAWLVLEYGAGTAVAVGAVANWLCVGVVATLPRNDNHRNSDDEPVSLREAARVAQRFVTDGSVRTVVVVGALSAGAMYTASFYLQPVALAVVPADGFVVSGLTLPDPVVLAMVYIGLTAASAVVVGSVTPQSDGSASTEPSRWPTGEE